MNTITRTRYRGLICHVWLFLAVCAGGEVEGEAKEEAKGEAATEVRDGSGPGLWERVLWYVPNRVLDFTDMCRLRLRVGPGVGMGVRLTDYAAFYAGSQQTVFVGLPGPRGERRGMLPVGREAMRGLVILGVDATDDLAHPPRYGVAESGLGVQAGLVGAEAMVDPVEVGDFLAGFLMMDLKGDDLPRPAPEEPARGSVLSLELNSFSPEKPAVFSGLGARLDYLEENVPKRLQGRLRLVDRRFVRLGETPLPQPDPGEVQVSLYARSVWGKETEVEIQPDLRLDLALPNFQHRMSLFVESSVNNDLPGRDRIERRDEGWTVGLRRRREEWRISTDAGLRARMDPEFYARVQWAPVWQWGTWGYEFEQRVFWENREGVGLRSALQLHRWFAGHRWIYRQRTAGRVSEGSDGYEWSQSVGFCYPISLLDERDRENGVAIHNGDSVRGREVGVTVLGSDRQSTDIRLMTGTRWSMYRDVVIGEARLGPQWRKATEWDAELRVEVGIDLRF